MFVFPLISVWFDSAQVHEGPGITGVVGAFSESGDGKTALEVDFIAGSAVLGIVSRYYQINQQ